MLDNKGKKCYRRMGFRIFMYTTFWGGEGNMKTLISTKGKRVLPSPPYGKIVLRLAAVLLAVVLLLANLFTHVFMVVRYYGDGMDPSLSDRQLLVLLKTDKVQSGDIIAFYYNNKVLVRRVICEGGHSISLEENGTVTIDGTVLSEPYVQTSSIGQHNISFPYHVPYGHYFVMGDNRSISMDSRLSEIGTVPADRILGKVL